MDSCPQSTTQALPVLYIRANSHYEAGKAIGSTFKGWIDEYMKTTDPVRLQKFYQSPSGKQIYEKYLSTAQTCCPQTVDEIRGMADGAEQPFERIFLLQIYSEVLFYHLTEVPGSEDLPPYGGEGCTDILVNRPGFRMIAHNDDWDDDVGTRSYIVDITIQSSHDQNDMSPPVKPQHFVSFAYPGYLPGFCFGMNEKLVITLNTLLPLKAWPGRVPVLILLRSLLSCESVEDCQRAMQNGSVGCAYGMNINIATIQGNEMYSMEVYPDESGTKVHVYNVPYNSGPSSYFHHQNHYKHLSALEQDGLVGTKLREKRADIMGPPQNTQEVKAILGDTEDPVGPLYRIPRDPENTEDPRTVATAVFNITDQRLDVYRSNPKLSRNPCLSLPFLRSQP